ncbi:MAG: PmoA family protein [Cyclobacteriaceae bacterium]|nr:PmoA family protein [Cyclobacteriaceae bacterium]
MKLKLLIALLFLSGHIFAKEIAKFAISFDNEVLDAPVSISLDGINYNNDTGQLMLFEVTSKGNQFVLSQIEFGHTTRLWFLASGLTLANTSRKYVLEIKEDNLELGGHQIIKLNKKHQDLQLVIDEKPILSYRFGVTYPPEDINPLYRKSGFIHPLWSPGGEVLTRIQPSDHYHHYGIWGPWTKTHIDDREVDFWNLAKGEGTVNFAEFISTTEGAVFSGFKALQHHLDFGVKGEDQVALNEVLDIRAWNVGDKFRVIDYTSSLTCPLENGILFDAYRYGGGIGFRATEKWHKDNCTLLTSEGKERVEADGSLARWCLVEGESETPQGRSGILFLSHPSNRMHPEPMRVWPPTIRQGRGDLFFEFTPIRYEDWKLERHQSYVLKYRLIVFDGEMSRQVAEKLWNAFAYHPVIEFKVTKKDH